MLYTLNLFNDMSIIFQLNRKGKKRRNKLAYDTERSAPGTWKEIRVPLTLISRMLPS